MIHEFKCRNVLSFKEEALLSFEATADKAYRNYYCVDVKSNLSLLKVAIVYGQNAAGKSNLVRALHLFKELVTSSQDDKTNPIKFMPFLLDEESRHDTSYYYLSFFIDKKKFIYEIEHDAEYIHREHLMYYPGTQPATLFSRTFNVRKNVSEILFGDTLKLSNREKIILEGNTIKNTSVLGIYSKSNVDNEILDLVKHYFDETFMGPIMPSTDLTGWTSARIEKNSTKKAFVVNSLKKADFNIDSIIFEEQEHDLDEAMIDAIRHSKIPDDKKKEFIERKKLKLTDIKFRHQTDSGNFDLDFGHQSDGTKRYYGLSGALEEILNHSHVLAIDEIESSLHTHLVSHFFKTFLVNSVDSQLLFTTHDLLLMKQEFIRRDVIWFVEKKSDGSSDLYAASDFKLHKTKSIFNEYQLGKLGAVPVTGNIFVTANS